MSVRTLLGFLIGTTVLPVLSGQTQPCVPAPPWAVLDVPAGSVAWMPQEGMEGTCDAGPEEAWVSSAGSDYMLAVRADGPSGSGRFWTITVTVSDKHSNVPRGGVCFVSSTIGWRTLRSFETGPLAWLDDIDGNGEPELVVWGSFPLETSDALPSFGMMAWVYRLAAPRRLEVDMPLSRAMAARIAAAYREPADVDSDILERHREIAAAALGSFATGACSPIP